MKRLSWVMLMGVFEGAQALLGAFVGIRDYVVSLGWSWWTICKTAVIAAVLAACAYGLWQYTHPPVAVLAPSAPVLADIPKQEITSRVQVYHKRAKAALHLPKEVQQASGQVVLAALDLPHSKHQRAVSAVLDTDTGEVKSYVEEKPLPWVEPSSVGGVGVYMGLKNFEPAVRAELRQDLINIKGVAVGAVVTVDRTLSGTTDTFAGVGARYEW